MKTLLLVILAALLITAIAGAGSYAWNGGGYWARGGGPAWMGYGDCPMAYGTLPAPPSPDTYSRGYRDGYCFGPGMRGKRGMGGGQGVGYGRRLGW
ncbi:MAG: hypothetical protein RDU20_11765 [Desulfomonilaceae bacterium]|nr:hypothetical protein [Desulfomonilaceae bacterium]